MVLFGEWCSPVSIVPNSLRSEPSVSEVVPSPTTANRESATSGPVPSSGPKSVWPLAAVLSIFGLGLLLLLAAGARELDRFARDQTHQLAETALRKSVEDVAFVAGDYGFWDAAVEALTKKFDMRWADNNVGEYAAENLGMSRTLVLGANNEPVYAMIDGETSTDPTFFPVPAELAALAEQARATSWDHPEASSAFIVLDGRHFIASAAVLTPEEPPPAEIGSYRRSILIFLRQLDDEWLTETSDSYLLAQLRIGAGPANGNADYLPLDNAAGTPVGYLLWSAPAPGRAFLQSTSSWVLVILFVVTILILMSLRRAYAQAEVVQTLNAELLQRSHDLEESQQHVVRALEEATAANKAKADFLAVMSHELRTPLNAVIGFSDLIRTQAFGPVGSPKYLEYGNDIHSSGQHLLALISDILDISRTNEGTFELNCAPVSVSDILDRCLTLTRPQAARCFVRLDAVHDMQDTTIMVDEVRLLQILTNLVNNAIKSSAEGTAVRIKISPEGRDGIAFRVIDTGCGIPKHALATVTEPFRQAGSYRTRFSPYSTDNAGAGLGLAIVKRLTEAHGGTLHIASKVGLGTVVKIHLPKAASLSKSVAAGGAA
jgi:two-component system, cell cycle sensor histidine kinase PleC